MNIIKVEGDHILEKEIHSHIDVEFISKNELFHVNCIKIKIKENCALEIEYQNASPTKLDIHIEVIENVSVSIGEIRQGDDFKIRYTYFLKENSHVLTNKLGHNASIKELDIVYLDGRGAAINYFLKTLSTGVEKYDTVVYHHACETTCNLYNHAVNTEDGEVCLTITNVVPNQIKDCQINQNSRIITLNQNSCAIKPILLIDENDVSAEHSAHIGSFDLEELFYLQSRGIQEESAKSLLIKGFLKNGLTCIEEEKQNRFIDTYWR